MNLKKLFAFVIVGALIGVAFAIFTPSMSSNITMLNDQDHFDSLQYELLSAEESIHVMMFGISYYDDYPDSPSNKLLDALDIANKKGLDVRVITDTILFDNQEGFDYLEDRNISIKSDTEETITHNKLIIIDGKIVFVGSSNWSYHALAKNHESNVKITSENTAKEFEEYFEEVWNEL